MPLNVSNTEDLFARGIVLHQSGRLAEAEQLYRQVRQIDPQHAGACGALGVLALQVGRLDTARDLLLQAVALGPHPHFWCALGDTYATMGDGTAALEAYGKARSIDPEWLPAYNNAAVALLQAGRVSEAIELYEGLISRALKRGDPACVKIAGEASSNLAEAYMQQGSLEMARRHQRRAVELCPAHAGIGSNWVRGLACMGEVDPVASLEEHRRWWQTYTRSIAPLRVETERDPDRPLRIGFVSPDFRYHSVAHFLLPLFERHDPARYAFFGYSAAAKEDDYTVRLARSAQQWRKIVGHSDSQAAASVHADRVDILVDLAGHTGGNRMPLFAYRPAPIQVAWLGYPATTGGSVLDYRITDALADPPGLTESHFVERLWRLDRPAWCFRPSADVPPVPRERSGPLTFGSFNSATKYADSTLRLWANVLRAAPASRLLLKAVALSDEGTRRVVMQRFAALGIDAQRIVLRDPQRDPADHLASYCDMDVALDTYPYHGTTTTCDALWMGVPVVTLAGKTHLSRVGVSLLSAVGLPEFVAETEEGYVAAALAAAERTDLRGQALRERTEASPLRDEVGFARAFEGALRGMWRAWCGAS